EMVEFYDPTDVFGDLADALAEAFPAVAPELAGATDGDAAEGEGDDADSDNADAADADGDAESADGAEDDDEDEPKA
ncbi:MAG: hypothetical protein H0T59_03325, partial [Chloroflexi bacterium]|nr:hypothetical protein [Chloroflexota bacterium]